MSEPIRILFVCLGNICRSPSAEGVFRSAVQRAGLETRVQIDSAGTGAWHVGKAPDPRAQNSALSRGFDISSLRARKVHISDFESFDLVIAMDEDNLFDLRALSPPEHHDKITLLLSHGRERTDLNVPDPYYGGDEGFDYMMDLIEEAAAGLLQHVKDHHL